VAFERGIGFAKQSRLMDDLLMPFAVFNTVTTPDLLMIDKWSTLDSSN